MGKCFVPNAVRRSHGIEEITRPHIGLLASLTNTAGIAFKSKNTVKYPDLLSAARQVPHIGELHAPKPPKIF